MALDYVTIPRSEYLALLNEVRRGAEVCSEIETLRILLQALLKLLQGRVSKNVSDDLRQVAERCDEVSRLRVELVALERRLREFDQELTPVRPPSRQDIATAFANSVEFAQGKRKP